METPHSRRTAGAALEMARRKSKISQRELARRAEISETWYRALTKGLRHEDPQPASDEVWVRLAQAAGASVPEIFATLGRDAPEDRDADGQSDQSDDAPGVVHEERGP
ncbi:transcriptional regulator with XRE-family HTH domain, partial [Lipingzhangella halophila]